MTRHGGSAECSRRDLLAGGAGIALAAAGAPRALANATQPAGAAAAPAAQGAALWEQFCDALKPLARHVASDDPLLQLEGVRCLSRLVPLGLERFLEHADPRHPSFYELQTPVRKYLGDNPDQTYRVAAIEGGGRYRVRGTAAGAAGVEVGVYAGTFRRDAGAAARRLVASRDETTLETAPDGSFELTLGPESGSGNHLKLAPDASSLLIRTYFWDRELRRQHLLPRIERLDVSGPPAPLTPEALTRGLLGAAAFVDGSLDWWNRFQGFRTTPNTLIEMPDDGAVQTPSRVRYLNGIVALAPEEALRIDFTPNPEPRYWSWTLQNLWGETPDWRYRPVQKNNRELQRAADGSVRVVIAHRDPGVANWMDMAGHGELVLALRWRGEEPLPKVKTRVVPLASFA